MRIWVLLFALLISTHSVANTLKLNYSLFFGYMKTMYQLDYQDVTTAFYLVDASTGGPCVIQQAEMVVDNKREVIDFQRQGRLLPFYSDQHRKDGAMIEVKTRATQPCALQVSPMAKARYLAAPQFKKLTEISTQLEGVLHKNAGMIGKYFLPTYQGLRFKLSVPLAPDMPLIAGYKRANNGDLLITNRALQGSKPQARLPYKLIAITPWLMN